MLKVARLASLHEVNQMGMKTTSAIMKPTLPHASPADFF
ncbi:hypothetical protein BamMEX5DRAFT_5918 [Burkholderia ambifaria MEX-5]|uniref:Uncharacterized protein n=1 Tax=Burkholderia ambifaria MEX-5 TaxID=396597 RepID=B1TDQ2_9BURK|nr:hypothetical protein BamMEX5DRAFT_5918 [Burkholderia ambifaria MEX-5]